MLIWFEGRVYLGVTIAIHRWMELTTPYLTKIGVPVEINKPSIPHVKLRFMNIEQLFLRHS